MATTKIDEVFAVTEKVKHAGATTWWRLSGTTDLDSLRERWVAQGLDENDLPSARGPEPSLRRAVQEQKAKRRLVRPLEGQKGWSLVDETAEGDKLAYRQQCLAKVDAVGRLSVEPEGHPLTTEIQSAYDRYLAELTTSDISNWLVRDVMRSCRAVALREGGGIYFVPDDMMERFHAMVSAITGVTKHTIYEMPCVHCDKAVEAILDAVTAEAQSEIEGFEKVLDEDKLGARALRSRAEQCTAVETKVESYEKLLGKNLDDLRAKLDTLRARLSEAAMAAEED